jgi:hypothetical protein
MKAKRKILLSALLFALPLSVLADPHENGHGKHHGHDKHEYKEEYWDGNCKVERKMGKHGEYKEKRKCKGDKHAHYHPEPVYVPAPVVVQPGIVIQGAVRIP